MFPAFVLFDDNRKCNNPIQRRKTGDQQRTNAQNESNPESNHEERKNRLYHSPSTIKTLYAGEDINFFFESLEKLALTKHIALACTYELGYYLEDKLKVFFEKHRQKESFRSFANKKSSMPLAVAGIFDNAQLLTHSETNLFLENLPKNFHSEDNGTGKKPIGGRSKSIQQSIAPDNPTVAIESIKKQEYIKNFSEVKKILQEGKSYQVNLTFSKKYSFPEKINLIELYKKLRESQQVSFGSLFCLPSITLLSRSPELFLRKENQTLTTRPMKGTIALEIERDHRKTAKKNAISQAVSKKSRVTMKNFTGKHPPHIKHLTPKLISENLIIVDLLRNDLSRISEVGSTKVTRFLTEEKYQTLKQITSEIKCQLKKQTKLLDILRATYPCGSITGAPKISTMQSILKIEKEPRDFYCGLLGYTTPTLFKKGMEKPLSSILPYPLPYPKDRGYDFSFSVAIRTIERWLGQRRQPGEIPESFDSVRSKAGTFSSHNQNYSHLKFYKQFLMPDYFYANQFKMGVGGGITIDSQATKEYAEANLKSHFLEQLLVEKKLAKSNPMQAPQMRKQASQVHKQASQVHKQASQMRKQASQMRKQASQMHKQASQMHKQASQMHKQAYKAKRSLYFSASPEKMDDDFYLFETMLAERKRQMTSWIKEIFFTNNLHSKTSRKNKIDLQTYRPKRWEIKLISNHLDRLEKSASELGFVFDRKKVLAVKDACLSESKIPKGIHFIKMRLCLYKNGSTICRIVAYQKTLQKLTASPLTPRETIAPREAINIKENTLQSNHLKEKAKKNKRGNDRTKAISASAISTSAKNATHLDATANKQPLKIKRRGQQIIISHAIQNSSNPFLFHKSSQRKVYNEQYWLYAELMGFYDCIFLNEQGKVTEGSRHNLFIVDNGKWYTPDVSCGLLAGVMRAEIIKKYKVKTRKNISIADLLEADAIHLSNSVNGLVKVELATTI